MTNQAALLAADTGAHQPIVRKIACADLAACLRDGLADFMARPTHALFLCVIYPVAGLLITRASMRGDLLPLLFPLAAGFALLGPFAAIGLYELSRRREEGLEASWRSVFAIAKSPSVVAIGGMGLLLTLVFVFWLGAAQSIYDVTLGPSRPTSIARFASDVLTTPKGWTLIVVGNAVGFVFAEFALFIGIVSVPLLLHKDVSLLTAVATSARCMVMNPVVLTLWGAVVGLALLAGSLPLFVGLAIVLPVLGHSTWHLYRKLVDV